ncbi:MAG: DUF4065 domain-containing protein [Oscillospiraceae bacterium]|nr:DUF4065 domain-containing protein [Oscillospiraceae bacterium]
MVTVVDVAAYVIEKYEALTGEQLSEVKLHKLLYFIQRESLALAGYPAFRGAFEGWKIGPVSPDVHNNYFEGEITCKTNAIPDEVQYLSNNIIFEYGALASWKLTEMSYRETSWENSRKGLTPCEKGYRQLILDDIREDAKKVRLYDPIWDMYYDEFDDATR